MRRQSWLAIALLTLSFAATARADEKTLLDPLIGEWNVGPPGGATAFVQRFSFGPQRAYLWVVVGLVRPAGDEHLHFEGLVAWNAATRRFDYLFAVEPGSGIQERGEFYAAGDGSIIRDVLLTAANGSTSVFRQTFRDLGGGRIETTLMRKSGDGWTPTFPGSDQLVMVRRER